MGCQLSDTPGLLSYPSPSYHEYIKPFVKPDGSGYGHVKINANDIRSRHELEGRFKELIDKEMATFTNNTANDMYYTPSIGGGMPRTTTSDEISYGRLVRIPATARVEAGYRYLDVTEADARKEAKRLRKLARQIDKAIGR